MDEGLLIGLTSCGSSDEAARMARGLLEAQLASCVKIDADVRSLYLWKGKIEDESEIRVMIKFPSRNAKSIEAYILANHSYEVPEWIVLRPEHVSQKYLEWAVG